jgi:hypothetical protein
VLDSFVAYSRANSVYPVNDEPFTSPALNTTHRLCEKMREKLDPALTETQPLKVEANSDTHNHFQFAGDGTPEHPPLYNREVSAFLHFHVNANRFVIAYYVMTRDVKKSFETERYTLTICGLCGRGASVTTYDPITDR